jgi:hypothetical protein
MGMTLLRVGELIGRSRAPVARFQSEFSAWFFGRQDKERKCGGQRRAYLTFAEEKEFWSGFLKMRQEAGFWWSERYALRWKRSSDTRWSKLPYTGCWQDMAGGKYCLDDDIPGPMKRPKKGLKKLETVVAKENKRQAKKRRKVWLMFHDEPRFGRINGPQSCWAPPGVRPSVP